MCQINTVRGPVPCTELGTVLAHEHLFVTDPQLEENFPGLAWDEADGQRRAADQFRAVERAGVGTMVDLTVMGLGRSISRVIDVAARTPVHIVAATGYYTMDQLASYFESRGADGALGMAGHSDPLPGLFVAEIESGIANTAVKAGVIKVSSDARGIGPAVRRVIEAAAEAHGRTGVPIFTHSDAPARTGLDQLTLLTDLGVPASRVLIGHCDNAGDEGYLRELMDAGASIGIDQFGFDRTASDAERIDLVCSLIDQGYADSVVISHDSHVMVTKYSPTERTRLWPNWCPTWIFDYALPQFAERGLAEVVTQTILRENPQRLLRSRQCEES
ncbi:MAG: hypothetical protein QM638_03055 [Nocardioides sp.]|uniref:phosphotriesterase family protein n=1 Tax=Nocardioides sp. TaxID=35761 RepID=UPI0039E3DB7F